MLPSTRALFWRRCSLEPKGPWRPRAPRTHPRRSAALSTLSQRCSALQAPQPRTPHEIRRTNPPCRTLASSVSSTTIEYYHEQADVYIERAVAKTEALIEETDAQGYDVEYSAGVLNIVIPDKGTYVINKQPPNRQIWLSSPISGPKRYDIVEGNEWVYLRDESRLSDLLKEEIGIDMDVLDE